MRYPLQEKEGYKALMKIPGMTEGMAEQLFNGGLKSIAAIAAADAESLTSLPQVDEKMAQLWTEAASRIIEQESFSVKRGG